MDDLNAMIDNARQSIDLTTEEHPKFAERSVLLAIGLQGRMVRVSSIQDGEDSSPIKHCTEGYERNPLIVPNISQQFGIHTRKLSYCLRGQIYR